MHDPGPGGATDAVDNDTPETGDPQPALGSASVAEVEQQLDEALAKANENYDLFLRARADADNVRRRSVEDVAKAHKFAIESFAEALLPVVDSLEKALETRAATADQMREGSELTLRQLRAAFEKNALDYLGGSVLGVLDLDAILLLEGPDHQRLARGIGMAPPDELSFFFGSTDQPVVFILGSDPPVGNLSSGVCRGPEEKT